jgi:hypothetical protein
VPSYGGLYIQDIQPFMESLGFQTLQLVGSNVATSLNESHWDYWRAKEEEREALDLIINKVTDPYLLEMSSHLLYIGKKR